MKKIFSLVVLLAAVTMFTGCGEDDATYVATPKLEVSKADVLFEAVGGTGSITVNTSDALTATTESKWVTLSVSGNTVTVQAQENNTLTSRSATITLKAGGTEAIVSATQKGGRYGLESATTFNLDDASTTLRLPLVHTLTVECESLSDWLTASFDTTNDEIVVNVNANDSGWRRTGKVAFKTGDIRDTITVSQFDFLNDVQGTYALVYQASNQWTYQLVQLERVGNGNNGQLRFLQGSLAELGVSIPLTFDPSTYSFSIYNLTDLNTKWTYKDVEYDLMVMVNYTNGSSVYKKNDATLAVIGTLSEEDDGVFFDMDMNDVVNHNSYEFYCLRIGYTTDGYAGYKGAYTSFIGCYLQKM